MSLEQIDRIVIVLLENRSFDHALGYLSLPDASPKPMDVNGLCDKQDWLAAFANSDSKGHVYPCHALSKHVQTIGDPPHDLADITIQINTPTSSKAHPMMGGFVRSYEKTTPSDPSAVMGYYKADAVPIFDFFARNFVVCDRWFSALPTGTQANRLVAMGGESKIFDNVANPLRFPDQDLVYDWLTKHEVDWCSYQWAGFPFFFLMARWRGRIWASMNDINGGGRFRRFEWFEKQWTTGENLPDVIFIEPKYTDDVVHRIDAPNDDHSPTGIAPGQVFLSRIYRTLISNRSLWAKTLLIITYDEHGGFFDHVPPLEIPAVAGGKQFKTCGVRVPAFLVSPQVEAGTICKLPLDHTSILQLLADKFSRKGIYSEAVSRRQKYLKPLKDVLLKQSTGAARRPKIAPPEAQVAEAMAQIANEAHLSHPPSMSKTAQAFQALAGPGV